MRDLNFWTAVYLGSMETSLGVSDAKLGRSVIGIESSDNEEPKGQMTKTRSYDDLIQAQDHSIHLHRRLSDPSLPVEK